MKNEEKYLNFSRKAPTEILFALKEKKAPFDVFKIAEKMGLKIKFGYISNCLLGGQIQLLNKEIIITLTTQMDKRDNSIVLAYLIGVLVYELFPRIEYGETSFKEVYLDILDYFGCNPMKLRPIKFAEILLMPSFSVHEEADKIIKLYKEDRDEKIPLSILSKILSNKFEVPEKMMVKRIKDLQGNLKMDERREKF